MRLIFITLIISKLSKLPLDNDKHPENNPYISINLSYINIFKSTS
jgi:hypothetical protein